MKINIYGDSYENDQYTLYLEYSRFVMYEFMRSKDVHEIILKIKFRFFGDGLLKGLYDFRIEK